MIRVTGLWAKSTASDGAILTGRLGGIRILILKNKRFNDKNDPTHTLYIDEKTREAGVPASGRRRAKRRPAGDEATPENPGTS